MARPDHCELELYEKVKMTYSSTPYKGRTLKFKDETDLVSRLEKAYYGPRKRCRQQHPDREEPIIKIAKIKTANNDIVLNDTEPGSLRLPKSTATIVCGRGNCQGCVFYKNSDSSLAKQMQEILDYRKNGAP